MGVVGGNSRRYRANKKAAHAADPDRPQLLNPHRIKPLRQYHALKGSHFPSRVPLLLRGKFLPFLASSCHSGRISANSLSLGSHFQNLGAISKNWYGLEEAGVGRRPLPLPPAPPGGSTGPSWSNRKTKTKTAAKSKTYLFSVSSLFSLLGALERPAIHAKLSSYA
jgi:hypothetical protein